jgi:hypothetical protein
MAPGRPEYLVGRTTTPPSLHAGWDDPAWATAAPAEIRHFRPESSGHRPETRVRMLYDATGLYGIFRVRDRYVRCVRTELQSEVYKDSCVELFVQPRADAGYFNFELNCGGALLAHYIVDPTRVPGGFLEFVPLTREEGALVPVRASLPPVVAPEIRDEIVWTLAFRVPFALLERHVGPLGDLRRQVWRGNFHKCADETSHPHWAAWSPVDELNFHLPRCFGNLRFAA